MTRAVVDPSVCGLTPVIQVTRLAAQRVRVVHGTHCETVDGMNVEWENLNLGLALKSLGNWSVYGAAAQYVRHAVCPIPMIILEAIEAEVGATWPKDVGAPHSQTIKRPPIQSVGASITAGDQPNIRHQMVQE